MYQRIRLFYKPVLNWNGKRVSFGQLQSVRERERERASEMREPRVVSASPRFPKSSILSRRNARFRNSIKLCSTVSACACQCCICVAFLCLCIGASLRVCACVYVCVCVCVCVCACACMFVRLDRRLGFASRGLGFASRGLGFASLACWCSSDRVCACVCVSSFSRI